MRIQEGEDFTLSPKYYLPSNPVNMGMMSSGCRGVQRDD
jgi:hypothetical protein